MAADEGQIGRAGFHVVHTHAASDRRAILDEMMRELSDESIARWAARNNSIVVADQHLDRAYVNDGRGGFIHCTDVKQVLDYGQERLTRVRRKITPPHPRLDRQTGQPQRYTAGPRKGQIKMTGTTTTTMIVSHLPKSMCTEVKGFYPIVHTKGPLAGQPKLGRDGQPRYRSRWVARDRDEAQRYFEDVRDIVAARMSPDGQAGILGYDIQHSETTPHVQLLLDAFAEDPSHPGSLRADASRVWFSHKGRMAQLHAELKSELIARGWDISPDFDEDRRMFGGAKDEYGALREEQAEIQAEIDAYSDELDGREAEIERRSERLAAREQAVSDAEQLLPDIRRRAREEARDEGRREGVAQALADAESRIADEVDQRVAPRLLRLEEQERELADSLDHVRKLLAGTTREDIPLALDAFLDEPAGPDGRTYRTDYARFASQLRANPAVRNQKLAAAAHAKASRKAAHASRLRAIESGSPQPVREVYER